MKKPKLLLIGHARHGKDFCAEILAENFDFTFASSSLAAAEIFIYDELRDKYGYTSFEECYEDRMNHRAEWYDLICEYNKENPSRLASAILARNDCYVGMRSGREIDACVRKELFDLIIWIDASKRLSLEDSSSFDIDKSYADIIIDNNGTKEEFRRRVIRLGKILF